MKKIIAVLFMVFSFIMVPAAQASSTACPSRVLVSHRVYDGAPGLENTLEGAKRSFALGVRAVEIDIWMTKPEPTSVVINGKTYPKGYRELVLVHDNNWKRTTGVDKIVANTPWSQTYNIKSLNGYPVATLKQMAEFVSKYPGKGIMIQLKGIEHFNAPAIKTMLRSYGFNTDGMVVYKSNYRTEVDIPIIDDFAAVGFVAGIKTVHGNLPPLSLATNNGKRFVAINDANWSTTDADIQTRINQYHAAGMALSNLSPYTTTMLDDPRWDIAVLHTEDITKYQAAC